MLQPKQITYPLLLFLLCIQQVFASFNNPNHGFEEQKGQWADENGRTLDNIYFKSSIPGVHVLITNKGLSYIFSSIEKTWSETSAKEPFRKSWNIKWHRVDISLRNSTIRKENILKEEPSSQGYLNYIFSHCPQGIYGVNTYHKITIKDVYPGIDWVLYSNQKGLKYDFLIHPEANPTLIHLNVEGADNIELSEERKSFKITTSLGAVTEGELLCYQEKNVPVNARYLLKKERENYILNFLLSPYNTHRQLTIDPPLVWGTYYGGNSGEAPMDVDIDAQGNTYVTGYCGNFLPVKALPGAYNQATHAGGGWAGSYIHTGDAFILKFDKNNVRLWATYYGGSGDSDQGQAVALDASGNLFVTGYTQSNNLPLKNPGGGAYYKTAMNFPLDMFVAKFSPAGVLTWATLYGGKNGMEIPHNAVVDNNGDFIIVGNTGANDFPTQAGPPGSYNQSTFGGLIYNNFGDAFILKFNNNGVRQWATFLGGKGDDIAYGIDTDPSGNIYVTGVTDSLGFPTLDPGGGAYFKGVISLATYPSTNRDIFISKFNQNGIMTYSTFFGGTMDDYAYNIAYDKTTGGYAICGESMGGKAGSPNGLPVKDPGLGAYYKAAPKPGGDYFISKFSATNTLVWSTFIQGSGWEWAALQKLGLDFNSKGDLYFAGISNSTDHPFKDEGSGSYYHTAFGSAGSGSSVIFGFDNASVLKWGTLIPSDGYAKSLVVDSNDCIIVVGDWIASGGAVKDPGNGAFYQGNYVGGNLGGQWVNDAFIVKFGNNCVTNQLLANVSNTNVSCYGGNDGTAKIMIASGSPGYDITWTPTGKKDSVITGLAAGTYTVNITDQNGSTFSDTVVVTQPTELKAAGLTDKTICAGDTVAFTANVSGGTPTYIYNWNNGASSASSYSFAPASSSACTLVVTDSKGCKDTINAFITISPNTVAGSGPDKSICIGDTITISASGGNSYSWSPATGLSNANSANPIANPSVSTTYTVTVQNGSCLPDTETVTVNVVSSINAIVSANQNICIGDSAQITASGGTGYAWSPATALNNPNIATPIAFPTVTTTYTVMVSSGSCPPDIKTVTIDVISKITADAGIDTSICQGSSATLHAEGGSSYLWNTGQAMQSITVSPAVTTTYTVQVSSGNCSPDSDNITVVVLPVPTVDASASNISIKPGDSVTLLGIGNGSVLWNPASGLSCIDCPSPTVSPTTTTTYTVFFTDSLGCIGSDTITVFVELKCSEETFFLPNAFSPNSDKINDLFYIRTIPECVTSLRLSIYDRWGEKVFEAFDSTSPWDGTFNGKAMDAAVYNYVLEASLITGNDIVLKGNVSLIR